MARYHRTQTPAVQIRAREHELNVMELRLRGCTWNNIAAQLHITKRGAEKMWARGLDRIRIPNATEAKLELIEQNRRVQAQLWLTMSGTADPMEVAALSGRLLQAQQRMSALTGSDVPAMLALEIAQSAPPNASDMLTVEQLKSLPADDLRMLASIMARAKSGTSAPRAIETTAAPEPRRLVKAPPFGDGLDDDEPIEVHAAPTPEVIDPLPAPRPHMPTAREQFVRQRSSWDDEIDRVVSEMSMRCTGENDPNTAVYRARIEKLERLRDMAGDVNASRQI